MAKFVIAGRVDCPKYAKAEMLSESLSAQLPHFDVKKIVVSQEEWPSWVQDTCMANGWAHPPSSSPLIWRELIDRGGKGMYMGGLEEFCAYSQHYYNIVPSTTSDLDSEIAAENLNTYNVMRFEQAQNMCTEPLHVCITNASSQLAYQVASRILLNEVFGSRQILHLHLLDTSDCHESVQALVMELQDLAHHNLACVSYTSSPHEAFKAVAAVFVLDEFSTSDSSTSRMEVLEDGANSTVVGSQIFGTSHQSGILPVLDNQLETQGMVMKIQQQVADSKVQLSNDDPKDSQPSMENNTGSCSAEPSKASLVPDTTNSDIIMDTSETRDGDLLQKASKMYYMYGGILDYTAQKDVRVIIVGPYSNLGAALMAKRVSSIDRRNFIASSGLVESQASSVIALKLGVSSADVQHIGVWGQSQGYHLLLDVSCTQVSHFMGSIVGPDGFQRDIRKCLFDYKWLNKDFPEITLDRHNNRYSCYGDRDGVYLAEAVSLVKVMKDWWNDNNGWHSVGMVLDEDIAVSYPCICKNGMWEKVAEARLEDDKNEEFLKIVDKLKAEFVTALAYVTSSDNENNSNTPPSKL